MVFCLWLLFICPQVRADGWDDFSNNLATDLAPILSLFGEQITKQYLSESIYKTDYFIFALAPIGILTAVVSAIRVCGSPSLRAFIGRAQEGGGLAEAELCSSTSRDVCELYNNGGIARVFGRPKILEVVHDPTKHSLDDKTAGIYTFRQYLNIDRGKDEWNSPSNDDAEVLALSPNLSLNVGIKRKSRAVFRMVAIMGTALQLGVLVFATMVTYYLEWDKGGNRQGTYACPLTIVGTILLFCGVFLCAYIIGESTDERIYDRKGSHIKACSGSTIYWIQPGGQVLGDQVFDPFCYSDRKEPLQQYVTSWKERSKESALLVWTAVGTTMSGFALQFTGLRGMHSAVAVAQLGVMLLMSAARAALRMKRLKREDDDLAQFPDTVTGHELDWLAIRLEQVQCNRQSDATDTYDIDDTKIRCLWRFLGLPDDEQRIIEKGSNPHPPEGKSPARILAYRTRLAVLSQAVKASPRSAASAEHFNIEMVEVRETARKLAVAIESATNVIFSGELGVQQNWKVADSICWNFECEVEPNVPVGSEFPSKSSRSSSNQTLHLSLIRPVGGGPWVLQDQFIMEGLLGLWVWSLKFDPAVEVPDNAAHLRVSQAAEVRARRIVTTEREIAENELKAWLGGTILRFAQDTLSNPSSRRASPNTIWQKEGNHWTESSSKERLENKQRLFGWHTMKLSQSQSSMTVWSAPTTSSLTTLCAQEIFGSFLKGILGIVDYFRNIDLGTDARTLPLASKLATELVTAFVESGLGPREDALLCISPLFISPIRVSGTEHDLWNARKIADQLRQQQEWMQAERVLKGAWRTCLFKIFEGQSSSRTVQWRTCTHNVETKETSQAVENTKRTAIALGELYRWALRGDARTEEFGRHGIRWLSDQKSKLILQLPTCVKESIDRYIHVEKSINNAFPNQGKNGRSSSTTDRHRSTLLVDITLPTSRSWTPEETGNFLCMAAKHGWSEIVVALLELGANPNFLDDGSGGQTALACATQSGDTDTVQALLERGALPNLRDHHSSTPLDYAIKTGNTSVVQLLLSKPEVEADNRNRHSETPLWLAAAEGQEGAARLLVELAGSRVNVDAGNDWGTTPLMKAVKGGHAGIVRLLLDTGRVTFDFLDDEGCTVLWYACSIGHEEITSWVLEKSKDLVNVKNDNGQSPLMIAVENGHNAVVRLLLTVGGAEPDPNCLFQAVEQGNQEIVELFLGTGKVTPDVINDRGQTPILLAEEHGHEGIVHLLRRLLDQ